MKKSKAIILYKSLVCVGLLTIALSSCKTTHTISRAELHRTSEHVSKTDSLATHSAVTDSTYHNISVTDSTVITHIIETIITNTVDASGNILDTRQETNRTTSRDHNRIVNDQTSNRHNEQTDTTSKSNLQQQFNHVDSLLQQETNAPASIKIRPWWQIVLESLYNAFAVLSILAVIATSLYLSYQYIKDKKL